MDNKNMLSDEELEKVTGGAAKVVGAEDGTTTEDTVDAGTLIFVDMNFSKTPPRMMMNRSKNNSMLFLHKTLIQKEVD